MTHSVAGFFALIARFVRLSLGFVGLALLLIESLPAFTKDFANLACVTKTSSAVTARWDRVMLLPKVIPGFSSLTFSRCSLAKNM